MAVLWNKSRTFERDGNTDHPIQGAEVYFFNAGTTTPLTVYTDSAFSVPHDHPVVALGAGKWPAVYLPEGETYRQRITYPDNGETISDDDGISVPTTEPPEFPDSETPVEKTIQTGQVIWAIQSTAPTGFVRANGRSIGSAASGASERANADTEDLFLYLWNNTSLTVGGGRGGTAEGDWAADKTILLPDFRGRVVIGPDSFGNSAAGRVTDANLGEDSDTLLSAGGAQTHTLTTAELAAHTHGPGTLETDNPGDHTHTAHVVAGGLNIEAGNDYTANNNNGNTGAAGAHTHTISGATGSTGDGDPHNNLQPSIVIPAFIKL